MGNNDKFFLEEITGSHPEIPEPNGIEMLNAIADEAEVRLAFMPDKSKVCSFCGQTTKKMFSAHSERFVKIGYCCENCMSDKYCAVCGEHPTEDLRLFAFEERSGVYSSMCEKCYDRLEEKDFTNQ